MKHIFKKLHFGSSHDPSRSNEISPSIPSISASSPSSSPSPSPSPSPSCASDHRHHGAAAAPVVPPPAIVFPSPPSPVEPGARTPGAAADRADYFSSEEEYQVQLAMAISASNSEFRDDPDNDQIRAATLLSLGNVRIDPAREEENTAESLARRYWDYNVLDYDVKVIDGFYDIFGISANPAGHGKMPSLLDLQTNIGDLGFEVIIVNRAIDPALVELEQVAHCIALDCPSADIGLLVQRISDLVTDNMGGRVRDANDMLARWMERSTELRTSRQTSLLPIGGINVGLSRHRALLFKVLADNVGIPCKLVKGSHYTGVDDDAVNIIKIENEREFLVDLMAAPGTLIPADVLSTKDASMNFSNPRMTSNPTTWAATDPHPVLPRIEPYRGEYKGISNSTSGNNAALDRPMGLLASTFSRVSIGALPTSSTSTSNVSTMNPSPTDQPHRFASSTSTPSSQEKGEASVVGEGVKENLHSLPQSQDTTDPRNLFADLNPFQQVGIGKPSSQFKATETRKSEFQRRRENIASGPGRPPLPLVWKNRSACNEVSNNRQYDFVEGPFPRKNVEAKDVIASSSSLSAAASPSSSVSPGKTFSEISKANAVGISGSSYSPRIPSAGNDIGDTSSWNIVGRYIGDTSSWNIVGRTSGVDGPNVALRTNQSSVLASHDGGGQADKTPLQTYLLEKKHQAEDYTQGGVLQNSMAGGQKDGKSGNDKYERRKFTHDQFIGTGMILKDPGSSSSTELAKPHRLDPMLDDVAEWEIPWEDLVLGERIGLGSYGEVYHADWNGTEVAVKKFLDQDFSGDALDEFRREVRIMRRLRHPNVVLFMGAVTRPPNLSIITEFLPRGSLFRILHRSPCQIDEKRRIKMALDVAKGMNCLHASTPTIVHRDLKSPNLLVDKNWNVKVCDFGLSRLKHNTFLSSKSTAGTPEWMAPEVLRNEPSNEKCDVYSFGVILWELATLRMPWSGMNPMQVVGAVGFQDRRLDIPKEVDPLVARIIWECWQKDPSLRPSFAQLTSALKPLQQLVIPSHQDVQSPLVSQEISVNSTP